MNAAATATRTVSWLAGSVVLATPKRLPAGTRIVHTTTYDNSSQNPANPDPNRVVPWGEQSWDEMLYGTVIYREDSAAALSSR